MTRDKNFADNHALEHNGHVCDGSCNCHRLHDSHQHGVPLTSLQAPEPENILTQSEYGDSGTEDAALSIQSNYRWSGSNINLNYNFLESVPSYYSSSDQERTNFQSFNTQMRSETINILDQIETFTNLTFTQTNTDSATLTFGQARLPNGTGAWAYLPTAHPKGGDIWTNNLYSNTQNPTEGNYAHFVLMHEIGHALGLNHSFDTLSGIEASAQFSVMAYDWNAYFPATYMLYDIYSLQNLYGANMSYASGDDVYVLDSTLAYAVWDAGGLDTFDASHMNSAVVININEGSYSSVGYDNNIAVAFGAVIENATGGSGADKISGNEYNNILLGNAGNDTFIGSAGDDTINGGANTDTVIYETSIESFLISIVDSITVTLTDLVTNYATDTLIAVENYIFDDLTYSYDQLITYSTGTDGSGRPIKPAGSEFFLQTPSSETTIENSNDINLSTSTEKTIGISFETGDDVTSRQVLFEQGGGLRGMNIYIENGQLHHAAWNYRAGTQWGYKEHAIDITANTRYTTTLLFEATSQSSGNLTLYLNGVEQSSIDGLGYIYSDGHDIGIGMMRDESRFSNGNVRGDGHEFTGTIEQIVYYNSALPPAGIDRLFANLEYDWLVNLAPTAQDDSYTILNNIPTTFDVLSNDFDPNNDSLNIVSVSTATHGTITDNGDGTLLYAPNTDFTGTDSFTYTISDPEGLTHSATVSVTVTDVIPVNAPTGSTFEINSPASPTALESSNEINLLTATEKTIGISFETSNDITSCQVLFEQGGGLRGMNIYIEDGQLHHAAWNYREGTQWGFKENTINITTNTRYTTTLLFEATSQSSGNLTLYLNGVEQSSIDGLGYVYSDQGGVGLGIMHDQSRFNNGNARGNGYEFAGSIDQIIYYNQTLDTTDLTQLNQALEQDWLVNLAPNAQDDAVTISTNTATTLDVLENDSDPNNDTLDITSLTNTTNGTVTLNADDTILYSPDTDFEGLDSFTYTVQDDEGLTSTATVNITVTDIVVPDLPAGSIFNLNNPTSTTIVANTNEINLSTATEKTIGLSFETGDDITSRQVLFEQGGGLRGMNIYIENGQLHHAAWNYRAGTQWGYKEHAIDIAANTRYTTTLLFEATSQSSGNLTLYLNGVEQSSIDGLGYIYSDGHDIGIGMMHDESRFSNGNVRGDGHEFTGTIEQIVYYNEVLSGTNLQNLNDHLLYNNTGIVADSIINIEQVLEMSDENLDFGIEVSNTDNSTFSSNFQASNMIINSAEDVLTSQAQSDII